MKRTVLFQKLLKCRTARNCDTGAQGKELKKKRVGNVWRSQWMTEEQSSQTSSPVLPAMPVQLGNCPTLFSQMELKRTGNDQLYGDLCLHVNSEVLFCCQVNRHQMPPMAIPSHPWQFHPGTAVFLLHCPSLASPEALQAWRVLFQLAHWLDFCSWIWWS